MNKYKIQKNHGLIPRPSPQTMQPEHPSIFTIGLLPSKQQQIFNNFELHKTVDNEGQQNIVMFNEKEYLSKSFNKVCSTQRLISELANKVTPQDSLTILIANQPTSSAELSVGKLTEQKDSILKQLYQSLSKGKRQNTEITLSVIGIQNEKTLMDELNFEWIEASRPQILDEVEPIKDILKTRPSLKIIKQNQSIHAENITRQTIESSQKLDQILKHYMQIKNQVEYFYKYNQEDSLFGELFHFAEIEFDPQYQSVKKVVRSKYLLKINQYCKSTSSLMLRLGICLNHKSNSAANRIDYFLLHESKIFLYLSECFKHYKGPKSMKNFEIQLISQIGHQQQLREQYLNLSIFNQLSKVTLYPEQHGNVFYLKHYLEHEQICSNVNQLSKKISTTTQVRSPSLTNQKTSHRATRLKYKKSQRIKSKSFFSHTHSSLEKNLNTLDRIIRSKQAMNIQDYINADNLESLPSFSKLRENNFDKKLTYYRNSKKMSSLYRISDEPEKSIKQRQFFTFTTAANAKTSLQNHSQKKEKGKDINRIYGIKVFNNVKAKSKAQQRTSKTIIDR